MNPVTTRVLVLSFLFLLSHTNGLFAQIAINAGSDQTDRGHGIARDADGNIYVTGFFTDLADQNLGGLDSFADSWDIFIAKYNSSAVLQWAKQLGGSQADEGLDIKVKGDYVYVTGYFQDSGDFDPGAGTLTLTSSGGKEIFVGKYAKSDGSLVWARSVSASDDDEGRSIFIDASDNVYLTGFFKGTATFPGSPDISITSPSTFAAFIAKFDSSGDVQYAEVLGGQDETFGDEIVVDGSGNAYVAGSFKGSDVDFDPSGSTANLTSAGAFDVFIAKYDSSGAYVWAHRIGAGSDDMGFSLGLDASNNAYTTGYFQGTADFDPGAGTSNLTSAGNKDIFVVKLNTTGIFQWAIRMGGDQDDEGYSIAVDSGGSFCVTGYFKSTADFDPSGATVNLTSANNDDAYLARYDDSGVLLDASQLAGSADIRGRDVVSDGAGKCCITGFYNATADFDPASPIDVANVGGANDVFSSAGVYRINAYGDQDVFLVCLDGGVLPVELTTFTIE